MKITLEDIQKKFFLKNEKKYNSIISRIKDFIDVKSYKTYLESCVTNEIDSKTKNEIIRFINNNEYDEWKISNLKKGSIISNIQICAFANNFDRQGGVLESKNNDDDIFIRMSNGKYEYKTFYKTSIFVKNEINDNEIKCYIKTKEGISNPLDSFACNKKVSGVYGKKNIYIFEKQQNSYKFLGLFYTNEIKSEIVDNYKLFYWIFTNKNVPDENKIYLNSIKILYDSYDIPETEKEIIIKARIGQSLLKDKLYKFKKCCEITGISDKKLLIASHIKPWSKSTDKEKMDLNNLLLLSPLFDKLFDKGYISFDDYGKMIVSKKLSIFDKNIIFSNNNYLYSKIHVNNFNKSYLKWHRENIFNNIFI